MLIPINTDAPLYYFPKATILLIVANVVCFAATGFATNEALLDPWLLEYGNGINPLEWIPAAFAHGGWGHLIGNMFFLWGFGLVVEGKLGWQRFLPLYFLIAACWGAGVDVLTVHRTDSYVLKQEFGVSSPEELEQQVKDSGVLNSDELPDQLRESVSTRHFARSLITAAKGRCLGASGVIFGLMAISLVWAPKNEMHIVGLLGLRVVSFDVTILVYCCWYLALNIFEWILFPRMGSSGLHLVGGVVGFVFGVLLLKRGWVDCENWDLFAVMSGKYGRFADPDWALGAHGRPDKVYGDLPIPEGTEEDKRAAQRSDKGRQKLLAHVNSLIDEGDAMTAADELLSLRMEHENLCPDEPRTRRLALGLAQAEAWDQAEIWLQEYIDRFPEDNRWARIRMAQVLLTLQRPRAAISHLKGMKLEGLAENQVTAARKAVATAKAMIRDGIVDAESEW